MILTKRTKHCYSNDPHKKDKMLTQCNDPHIKGKKVYSSIDPHGRDKMLFECNDPHKWSKC